MSNSNASSQDLSNRTVVKNVAKASSTNDRIHSVHFHDVNSDEPKIVYNQQPARVSQPPVSGSSAPTSGYVIFGGRVQIFNDNWKSREPMRHGEWDYPFFDYCWERDDCLLATCFPCIYDCLLTTAISKNYCQHFLFICLFAYLFISLFVCLFVSQFKKKNKCFVFYQI